MFYDIYVCQKQNKPLLSYLFYKGMLYIFASLYLHMHGDIFEYSGAKITFHAAPRSENNLVH